MRRTLGFTIIELLMVIVIMGIIAVVLGRVLIASYTTFQTSYNISTIDWNAYLGIERMSNDIHNIRSPASITTVTATQLTFVDINGTTIQYTLSGNTLMRNTQILASNITSIAFSYLDTNGATTAVASAVRYIRITLGVASGTLTSSFTTLVATRILS